jgi:hypothetical protein
MSYSEDELDEIFDSTDGNCHICCGEFGELVRKNYAERGGNRGAWHVSHLVAVHCGGGSDLRNLAPAHIDCNLKAGSECDTRGGDKAHRHSSGKAAMCCMKCGEKIGTRSTSFRTRSAPEADRRCKSYLLSDGRMRCMNAKQYGRQYCFVH